MAESQSLQGVWNSSGAWAVKFFYNKLNHFFWDTLTPKIFFYMTNYNYFRGDLSDVSVKKHHWAWERTSKQYILSSSLKTAGSEKNLATKLPPCLCRTIATTDCPPCIRFSDGSSWYWLFGSFPRRMETTWSRAAFTLVVACVPFPSSVSSVSESPRSDLSFNRCKNMLIPLVMCSPSVAPGISAQPLLFSVPVHPDNLDKSLARNMSDSSDSDIHPYKAYACPKQCPS